eukprot:2738751-Pyramimonas_sp.AAC.3
MTRNGCRTDLSIELACVPHLGGILGPSWGSLGHLLGHPGALSWGPHGVLSGQSWGFLARLERSGALSVPFWKVLEPSWGYFFAGGGLWKASRGRISPYG